MSSTLEVMQMGERIAELEKQNDELEAENARLNAKLDFFLTETKDGKEYRPKEELDKLQEENARLEKEISFLKDNLRVARKDRELLQLEVGKGLKEFVHDCTATALRFLADEIYVERFDKAKEIIKTGLEGIKREFIVAGNKQPYKDEAIRLCNEYCEKAEAFLRGGRKMTDEELEQMAKNYARNFKYATPMNSIELAYRQGYKDCETEHLELAENMNVSTKWHKVADGEYPRQECGCASIDVLNDRQELCYYHSDYGIWCDLNANEIDPPIAWCEIPTFTFKECK